MVDKIVDSYGIIVPLLEFHPILSKCTESSESPVIESIEDDDDTDMLNPQTIVPPSSIAKHSNITNYYKSTIGKSVLESHPYVTTRCAIAMSYCVYRQ